MPSRNDAIPWLLFERINASEMRYSSASFKVGKRSYNARGACSSGVLPGV